jgi:hypothetical protein
VDEVMANRTRIRALAKLLGTGAIYCAAMTAAVLVAAECKTFDMETPDPETLNLKDGEHVIGSVVTPGGKIEARVVVSGKTISPNQYYLGGKQMRSVPDTRIPADIRECLGIKRTGLPSAVGWLSSAALALRDWIEPPLEARGRCKVKCHCNQNTCCCLASCGDGQGVGCAGF